MAGFMRFWVLGLGFGGLGPKFGALGSFGFKAYSLLLWGFRRLGFWVLGLRLRVYRVFGLGV